MILGTAGHVDHGKTALVRALTGVDTDRLPEEKRRGITIELGFAPLELEGVGTLGVVDVPGHEAFVRTMLAGATGVDLALLVIAADEGVMPQTREHLSILTLLGVAGGVVALTKSDLVEPEWLGLVETDVRALLAGSPLERAVIVSCSASTGAGIADLRAALAAAARAVPVRDGADLLRLPVDRVFSVRGTGTVVTGTLWSGAIGPGDSVRLMPGPDIARVRSVESHGVSVARALPGSRTAVSLGGISRDDIARGAVLVATADGWTPSLALRADVGLLTGAPPLGVRTRVRLHLGTAEVGARIVAAGGRAVRTTDAVSAVRVALDAPLAARSGDRFVLRAASPPVTIGGGVVTDPHPPAPRARPWEHAGAPAHTRLEWIVAECGGTGLDIAEIPIRVGVRPAEVVELVERASETVRVRDRVYPGAMPAALAAELERRVHAWHESHPDDPGLPIEQARSALGVHEELFADVLAASAARNALVTRGPLLSRAGWEVRKRPDEAAQLEALFETLRSAGSEPPSVRELTARFGGTTVPGLLRVLEGQKRVVAVAPDRYYETASLERLIAALRSGGDHGRPQTASEIKEKLGLTRKYLIPFLEYCDRARITVRSGDTRTVSLP